MRRSMISIFVACFALAACESTPDELRPIEFIPGVEIGNGSDAYNSTTYKGALLPEYPESRAKMIDVLTLIGKQEGDIDDNLFIDKLNTSVFNCNHRFMLVKDLNGEEADFWSDSSDWVGGQMQFDALLNDDGTLNTRSSPGSADPSFEHYLNEQGIKGYYHTEMWRYDSNTNTLYTSADDEYAAELLYFDGKQAILLGHVYPMWLYYSKNMGYKRTCPMELYLYTFDEGREGYLNGYISYDEYIAILEEYIASNEQ